jgi:predicted GNAT family N-acyltransferase
MNPITIAITHAAAPEYQAVWQLREEVLRKPLGMSLKNESLAMDADDDIFVAKDGEEVIGCLMLHHLDSTTIKFRQMAVYDAWQGKNIGRLLIETAEKYAANKGYKQVSLHARKVVSGFYTALGYKSIGDEFEEVGIAHLLMKKELI